MIVAALALAATASASAPSGPAAWDLDAVRAVNGGLASQPMDVAMSLLSNRVVVAGVPLLVALEGTSRAYTTAISAAAAEGLGYGLSEGLKRVIARQRPFVEEPTLRLPAGPESGYSFPSGHATVTFAAATVLAADEPRLAPWAYGFATAVSFSRVYLGVHHPSDVVAGAVLGFATGEAVLAARNALGFKFPGIAPAGLGFAVPF